MSEFKADQLIKFIARKYDGTDVGAEMDKSWRNNPEGEIAKFVIELEASFERVLDPNEDRIGCILQLADDEGIFELIEKRIVSFETQFEANDLKTTLSEKSYLSRLHRRTTSSVTLPGKRTMRYITFATGALAMIVLFFLMPPRLFQRLRVREIVSVAATVSKSPIRSEEPVSTFDRKNGLVIVQPNHRFKIEVQSPRKGQLTIVRLMDDGQCLVRSQNAARTIGPEYMTGGEVRRYFVIVSEQSLSTLGNQLAHFNNAADIRQEIKKAIESTSLTWYGLDEFSIYAEKPIE